MGISEGVMADKTNKGKRVSIFKDPNFVYGLTKFFKVLFYFLGFPLIGLLIFKEATLLAENGLGKVAYKAILIYVLLWLAISIGQLIFNSRFKKFMPRAIFAGVLIIVIMLSGVLLQSLSSKKVIEQAQKELKLLNDKCGTKVEIKNYDAEKSWFSPRTKKDNSKKRSFNGGIYVYNKLLKGMKETYNIKEYPSTYRELNVDGSKSKKYDPKHRYKNFSSNGKTNDLFKFGETNPDVYLNPNGLFADAFVFGVPQAIEILKAYHIIENYYKSKGQNAADILQAEMDKIDNKLNPEWEAYKETEEWKDAYDPAGGEMFTDKGYPKGSLDVKRLNAIFKNLLETLDTAITGGKGMVQLVPILAALVKVDSIEGIVALADKVLGKSNPLTVEKIKDLLSGMSSYISPQTKPAFLFVKADDDEELLKATGYQLRDYALAKYYGQRHGALVGSILIPLEIDAKDADGKTKDAGTMRIGGVTMDAPGRSHIDSFKLDELVELQIKSKYIPEVYPKLIFNKYVLFGVALMVVMTILAMYLGLREKVFYKAILNEEEQVSWKIKTDEEIEARKARKKGKKEKKKDKEDKPEVVKAEIDYTAEPETGEIESADYEEVVFLDEQDTANIEEVESVEEIDNTTDDETDNTNDGETEETAGGFEFVENQDSGDEFTFADNSTDEETNDDTFKW